MPHTQQVKLGVTAVVVLAVVIVLVAPSPRQPGMMYELGSWGAPLSCSTASSIPEGLYTEALDLAQGIYGTQSEKSYRLAEQMIGSYCALEGKDVLLIFNSGGWGWSPAAESEGWASIISGIEQMLQKLGYTPLTLEYQRTSQDIWGRVVEINEILASALGLPLGKVQELALWVEFLLSHIPGLQVILLGESDGATICEYTFRLLSGDTGVYTIQTGPPFWHASMASDRSLVIRNNGEAADSFSNGDLFTILRTNLASLLSVDGAEAGAIFYYIGAPGHSYSWEYPEVAGRISDFLEDNLGNE